jgi:hypothetical protein
MAGGTGQSKGTGSVANKVTEASDHKEGPLSGAYTTADSWAKAEAGALHGRASASANVWNNGASTIGFAEVNAGFSDWIKVDSTQVAVGTPVTLTFTQHVDGGIVGSDGFFGLAESGLAIGGTTTYPITSRFVEWDRRYSPNPADIGSGRVEAAPIVVTTTVGATVSISAWLRLQAGAGNGFAPGGSVVMSYGNTARYYGSSSLAGVSLIGSGGHNYAAPVPEPATLGVLLAGLAALRRRGRRRA